MSRPGDDVPNDKSPRRILEIDLHGSPRVKTMEGAGLAAEKREKLLREVEKHSGVLRLREQLALIEGNSVLAHAREAAVLLAFQNDPSPVVGPALKRALSGPLHPIHENSRNRDGRNIWFELALAAEWRLRGASVILGEPDLRLTREDVTFLVACKRPATTESIEANLRDAIK